MEFFSQGGNPKNSEVYFAAATASTLADSVLNKARSFYNTMNVNFYLAKLAKSWTYYHGAYQSIVSGESHSITFTGEQGELVNLPVNDYRNFGQHMLNMITANRPTMEARAINSDYKTLSQTILANSILDYYMREKKLEDFIKDATEMAIVLGSGYLRMEWNATSGELYDFDPETGEKNYEGELEFGLHSPWDVVFDGTKETWDTNEWILVRSYKNRFNLASKYPELKEKILGIPTKNQEFRWKMSVFSNDSTDDIPVYEFFHKKSEALPEGRYTLFLNSDTILLDLPLPYREIPIYRIAPSTYMGTAYGYSPLFDLMPLQEAQNSLYSTIMTNNNAFGVQNLFVKTGSNLAINSLEGALNILEGDEAPQPLNLLATAPETFKFADLIAQKMETLSGINSVTRGNPEASLKSGTALALVQSMSLQYISGLQNSYVKLIEEIGTGLVNILKDFSTTPKLMALVGKNNRPLLEEFTGDRIRDINRVVVSVGNPLANSTAGRVQMAEQMLQMNLIKTPQQYFQVIKTGSLDMMFESDMNDLMLIKKENEMFMKGDEVIADMLDAHSLHIMEHRSVLSDPELRFNPALRTLVQDHIQQHIEFLRTVDKDLLQLIGQAPLMNQDEAMAQALEGPMPPQGGSAPNNSEMMMPPNGMPQPPQEMITGQGNLGGSMLPQLPKPPPPFENMAVTADQMMPQG